MIEHVNVFLLSKANIRWYRLNSFSTLQALFEIIASEAIYVNRLHILITVFYEAKEFFSSKFRKAVISEREKKDLFLNIRDIWDVATQWVYLSCLYIGWVMISHRKIWACLTYACLKKFLLTSSETGRHQQGKRKNTLSVSEIWDIVIEWAYSLITLWPYLTNHDDVIKWKHFPHSRPLCGEFTGQRWIPLTKASDAELWCFLWSAPEQMVE